ncbi:hypothetical protein [Actibacterium sp. 188UL27-1]|uniref:hypothetical protein n=1 Tax=Actibacterium sp. 188UL27-1 TaxID=2786961 RepID=UPI0019569A0C|nr:hypothetical protein [Actibacterium sp. 188UL27-1]MBM7066474.1 hypothetical protein [Actibacterium sp. 188UL27-1]
MASQVKQELWSNTGRPIGGTVTSSDLATSSPFPWGASHLVEIAPIALSELQELSPNWYNLFSEQTDSPTGFLLVLDALGTVIETRLSDGNDYFEPLHVTVSLRISITRYSPAPVMIASTCPSLTQM